MRLKQLKLAGFKSFVDPTKISLPSDLSAIVGPNGCGKSNIIDAVRWVLGESSAKNLRGEGMTDVIFNGSTARKPISQASVELIFDNSDNKMSGPWQSYSEIAIKRQINRDGQADYFINGQKCRRRDITDLLSGTGLGPRSYAIIEQGTISRLVESKPQELRVFLEEAAGITKYKERRRETETRIKHSRENLSRLADIKHELDTQVSALESQAQQAEQYGQLKAQERSLNQDIIVLRWSKFEQELTLAQQQKQQQFQLLTELEHKQALAEQQNEQVVSEITRLSEHSNSLLQQCYQQETEVAKATAQVKLLATKHQDLLENQDKLQLSLNANTDRQQQQTHKVAVATDAAAQLAPQLVQLTGQLAVLNSNSVDTQQQLELSQQQLSDLLKQQTSLRQQLELSEHSSAKIGQDKLKLASQRELMTDKLSSCAVERASLAPQEKMQHYQGLRQQHVDALSHQTAAKSQLQQSNAVVTAMQQQVLALEQQQQKLANEMATNQLLISAKLANDDQMLANHYQGFQQLWQKITIAPRWQRALQVVLGDFLQAYCVETHTPALAGTGHRLVHKTDSAAAASPSQVTTPQLSQSLQALIECDYAINDLISGIFCADDLQQAKTIAASLSAGQSVITPCGQWYGQGFSVISAPANDDATGLGLLELEQHLQQQQTKMVTLQDQAEQLAQQGNLLEKTLTEHLEASELCDQQSISCQQHMIEAKQQWLLEQQKWQYVCDQHDDIRRQIVDLEQVESLEQQQLVQLSQQQIALNQQINQLIADLKTAQSRLSVLKQLRHGQQRDLVQLQHQKHDAELADQKLQMQLSATQLLLSQINDVAQDTQLALNQVIEQLEASAAPLAEQRQACQVGGEQLAVLRHEHQQQSQQLKQCQVSQERLNQSKKEQQVKLAKGQALIQRANLTSETLKVKLTAQEQALELSATALTALAAALVVETDPTLWPQRLVNVKEQLANIGPINLTAIEQYNEQKQRSDLLKQQIDDLESALETLGSAIKKIDKQSKEMFKQTFDAVNRDFKILFPKVFGGGSAQLTLTDSDLLSSGVSIMAQPPGKKNSTIHLLSGGEKALTALSLVFAIFQLNPAPFCMLDEVDAPLDDANVERYCNLVKEMSEKVQFIFITHNKVSMEMADHLTGITMMEAGVSRVVAVDVAQAVSLVQE
ncbi:MAG: chromosome segregation protein SMC [Gammaproteobacteria bacterium]|nr:chromosome segregation protein SMC [Gammaproteobacteria bacterium]